MLGELVSPVTTLMHKVIIVQENDRATLTLKHQARGFFASIFIDCIENSGVSGEKKHLNVQTFPSTNLVSYTVKTSN